MSDLQKRIEKLEERAEDVSVLGKEFGDIMYAVVHETSEEPEARKRAEPLLEKIRMANERKPHRFLNWMLGVGDILFQ